MNYYDTNSDEVFVPSGMSAIVGFQEVLTNNKKVHIWMKQEVERPAEQDRHRTTRMANHSSRKMEYGKSVWLKEEVYRHFGNRLDALGISKARLDSFEKDPECDLWVTKGDGTRKFLAAYILNPKSEITKQEVMIQVTQVAGKAPISIYERAFEESKLGLGEYKVLSDKYKNSAMVKTYSPYVIMGMEVSKRLTPVYVLQNNDKLPVYETSEIVLGNPIHKWVEFERFESIPTDILIINENPDTNIIESNSIETKVPEESELKLKFD